MASLITTRGLGRTQFALVTFGLGILTLVPPGDDGGGGCVVVEVVQSGLTSTVSDQALIDAAFAELTSVALEASIEITVRSATLSYTTTGATVTFVVERNDATSVAVEAAASIEVTDQATTTPSAASASSTVRTATITIDSTGDCT